jgi:protein-S-isoprenylcysteine O-methyltransferase Ste14
MVSKLLVLLQFGVLAVLVWPWSAVHWNAYAWLPIGMALVIVGWSLAHIDPGSFSIFPEPRANARLITSGPYARVRHPLYFALMILALGLAVGWNTAVHWAAAVTLVPILDVKSRREERLLTARFSDYADYASRTPRLVPLPRRRASG